MSQKTRIFIYILIAAAAVIMGVLGIMQRNSGGNSGSVTAQEKIDLGRNYLIALSYSQAVIEFTDAIEIEPLNAEAYLGLAEAYEGLGDTEKAVEALETGYELTGDERLKEMLDRLKAGMSAEASEYCENVTMYVPYDVDYYSTSVYSFAKNYYTSDSFFLNNRNFKAKFAIYSDIPDTQCIFYYNLNDDLLINSNCYFISCHDGNYSIVFHDGKGNLNTYPHPRIGYYDQDGNIVKQCKNKYDDKGNLIESCEYDSEGNLLYSEEYEYDEDGKIINSVDNSGAFSKYNYDSNGNLLSQISYNSDGKETYRRDMTYDADNNCTGRSDNYDKTTWEYDQNGNTVKTTWDTDGIEQTITFEYDAEGKRIRDNLNQRTEFGTNEFNTTETANQYFYDSKGRIIKKTENSSVTYGTKDVSARTDVFETITEYSYNSYDQIVNETQSRTTYSGYGDSEYDSISYYSYEYDSEGRHINKTENQSSNYGDSSTVIKYIYGDGDRVIKQEKYIDDELVESVELKYVKIEFPKIFAEQIYEKYGIDLTE